MAKINYSIVDTREVSEDSKAAVGFLSFRPFPRATYTEYRQPGSLWAYVVTPCYKYDGQTWIDTEGFCYPEGNLTFAYLYVVDSSGYRFMPIE